jgi:hypothetical protein
MESERVGSKGFEIRDGRLCKPQASLTIRQGCRKQM